jgi:septum formation protein
VALGEHDGAEQLAKPAHEADAIRMITTLAGRTHVVITGIALRWPTGFIAFTDVSKVTFKKLTEKQIADYVATGESMDKAGAYGIQGMASTLVERIEGSINNIIGLPTERLEEALRNVH